MKKIIPIIIIAIIIVGVGAFYGGMKYGSSQNQKNRTNLFAQGGANGGGFKGNKVGGNAGGFGGGATNGDIISKDDKSLTLKLRDGGSKIIFYSGTTEIGRFVTGAVTDLEVGQSVMVNSKSNSDGSLIAQSIQIRPTTSTLPGPK